MRKPLLAVLLFVLASLACSLPAAPASPSIDIPTFTPTASSAAENKPTDLPAPPTFTPEAPAPQPQVNYFDPRIVPDCDIFIDSDFPNTVGSIPSAKQPRSDAEKKACQYEFSNGALFVSIATSLPGLEAYETVRQFDAISGGTVTPYPIGEAAVFTTYGNERITLEAVLNGWYVTLDAQGFDEKHLVLLAELLLSNMAPYTP